MIDRTNIKDWGIFCWLFIVMLFFVVACSPKNYPTGKPYVLKSTVQLKAKMPLEQRKAVELDLYNYFDDSLKMQVKSTVGIKRLINPPVFDSANIDRSKLNMRNYFTSLGYYHPRFDTFTVKYNSVLRQQKKGIAKFVTKLFGHYPYAHKEISATVFLSVEAGIQTKVDTVSYGFDVPELEVIAQKNKQTAAVKKGDGYSLQIVRKELDRLVSIYNGSGYFKLSRGTLAAVVDTTDKSLVSLENDPLLQLQQAKQRQLNPTVGIEFRQRPNYDSSYFLKYALGNINIYPESFVNRDTKAVKRDSTYQKIGKTGNGVYIYAKDRLFRGKAIRRLNSLVPGKYYDSKDYFNTINAFTQVGAWQQADVKESTYIDSIPKVDLDIFLYPAKKYSHKIDLEGSLDVNKNSANLLAGNYVGVSLVGSFLNRNFAKSAVQWNSNVRGGFEVTGGDQGGIFQYLVGSVGTSFTIPRLWPPVKNLIGPVAFGRTYISSNFTYTDRKEFFTLKNLNAALVFEWRKKKDSKYTFTWKVPNIELVKLSSTDSLRSVIAKNPYLGFAFNKGLVVSTAMTVERNFTYKNPRKNSSIRLTGEESGLLAGKTLFGTDVFQFWKLDAEFSHKIVSANLKHAWAFRFIAGYGRDFARGDSSLPFFRQFIAGGPNSLRAWQLRQLGPGSSLERDTSSSSFKDRLADIYLEGNAEYRFNMFKFFGFPVEGALFTDVGNIWSRKPSYSSTGISNGGDLNIKSFYHDLAVASGFGFRINFTYLLIRADIGYKVKDPVRANDGWMTGLQWRSSDRLGKVENSNISLQIGIGYPFQ